MAVRVEAMTMVVRRSYLDTGYPGATDGFLALCGVQGDVVNFVVADEALVAVSSLDNGFIFLLSDHLQDAGAIQADDTAMEYVEYAFVDQFMGLALGCPWLEYTRDEEGVASVRLHPHGSETVVSPPGWTRDCSTRLVRTDMRLDTERMFKLSEEDGYEIWLDFQTGRDAPGTSRADRPGDAGGEAREVAGPAFLTKSRFTLATECPTKLYYTGKPDLYPNTKDEDDFLRALADGGIQVGELAKLMFPGGIEITSRTHAEQVEETRRLLEQDDGHDLRGGHPARRPVHPD
jgi:hypothetical protein